MSVPNQEDAVGIGQEPQKRLKTEMLFVNQKYPVKNGFMADGLVSIRVVKMN